MASYPCKYTHCNHPVIVVHQPLAYFEGAHTQPRQDHYYSHRPHEAKNLANYRKD